MAGNPTFYSEGSVPLRNDPLKVVDTKILGATIDFTIIPPGTVLDYATGGNMVGTGNPNGFVVASPGATYVDTTPPGTLYFKISGVGTNDGWV